MNPEATTKGRVVLVTGAARSGKSEWAETLAAQFSKLVVYVATAQIDLEDREWYTRIEQHRDRRPAEWITLEVPEQLTQTIEHAPRSSCLLIDSLGTWVTNFLEEDNASWEMRVKNLLLSLEQLVDKDVILVAEETGWGVVPAYPVGRKFRDRLGNLNRHIGTIANSVYLVTGGYVLNLTTLGSPLPPTKPGK